MSVQERWSRPASPRKPIWVVSPAGEDFQVYDPSNRNELFVVSGTPESPRCTCEEFTRTRRPCQHIRAVFRHVDGGHNPDAQGNGHFHTNGGAPDVEPAPCLLTLKRSVSPDGRIDSLSIELQASVQNLNGEVEERAAEILAAQERVAAAFLNGDTGHHNGHDDGTVPAQLSHIGNMQTRWGWRSYIQVVADGRTLKLFGNRKQLAEHLAAAGYSHLAGDLKTGTELQVPCRAILKPSEDGKYLNVEQVLPPSGR